MTNLQIVELNGGVHIAYDDAGSGEAILFIHGITEDRTAWDEITPALASDYRVIRVDLPSHGRSSELSRVDGALLTAVVGEFVQRLKLGSPHVIGHSLGGVIASLMAATGRASSVINVDQPFFMGSFINLLRELEPRLRGNDFGQAMVEEMDHLGGPLLPARVRKELCRYRADARQDFVLSLWTPLFTQTEQSFAAMLEPVLAQIRCPYLALLGNDPGPEYSTWLTRIVPSATVEIWQGLGHWLHRVDPERFVARVREFLVRVGGSEGAA